MSPRSRIRGAGGLAWLPALVPALLPGRWTDEPAAQTSAEEAVASALRCWDEGQPAAPPVESCWEVLAGASREELHAGLRRAVQADPRLGAAALRAIARLGDASDFDLLLDMAEITLQAGTESRSDPVVPEAFRALLSRDPAAYRGLSGRIRRIPVGLYAVLAEGIGRAGAIDGLPALLQMVGADPKLDPSILVEAERLAARAAPPFDPAWIEEVRWLLRSGDEALRAPALRLAGELRDHESIPFMIECLEGQPMDVRSAARQALQRVSGLAFRGDPKRWSMWYEAELRWWRELAPKAIDGLQSGSTSEIARLLGEISTKRLFREELVDEVVALLDDSDPQIRRLGCQGLAQLASRAAIPALVEALDDGDGSVVDAACSALRALTGHSRPPTREAWADVLDPRDPLTNTGTR